MSQFLPPTVPAIPAINAIERTPVVRPISASETPRGRTEADANQAAILADRSAEAAADYARIQADIADVLASIQPPVPKGSDPAAMADQAAAALTPNPVIILPLPPTDPQIVAFVAQVAQSVAQQAGRTRAAQANMTPMLAAAAAN